MAIQTIEHSILDKSIFRELNNDITVYVESLELQSDLMFNVLYTVKYHICDLMRHYNFILFYNNVTSDLFNNNIPYETYSQITFRIKYLTFSIIKQLQDKHIDMMVDFDVNATVKLDTLMLQWLAAYSKSLELQGV